MQCIFIDSKTSVRQIRHQLRSGNAESILIASHEIRPDLAGYDDARVLCLEEFGRDREAVYKGMNEWLRRWSNEALSAGRNIKQLLTYGGISLWWLMDCSALSSRSTPPNMEEMLHDLEAISMVLKHIRPTKVMSLNSDYVFNRCLEICCGELSISTVDIPRQLWTSLRRAVWLRALAIAHWIRFIARKLVFLAQRPLLAHFSQRQGRPTILVVSRGDWEPVPDVDSGAFKLGERHYQPILDRLQNEVDFCITIHLHSFRTVVKRPRQKCRLGCRFEPLEHAASLLRVWRACSAVRRQWQLLRCSSELWESARYKGLDLSSILRYRFDAFMSAALVEAMIGLDAAAALMRREKPSLLLHGLETSSVGKAFICIARQRGVPSLSLQHGTIGEGHPGGTPLPADIDLSYRSVDAWPFPDRMAVYGTAGRDALLKSNWPPQLIRITGAPRWDHLTHCARSYDKQQFCRRNGLGPQAPLVLFLSSILCPTEIAAVTSAVCQAVRRVPEGQLLIKLHPHDSEERRYREILKQQKMAFVPVFRKEPLHELIAACDIVVSVWSTSVIEAALVGRPTVVVDPQRRGYARLFHHSFVKATSNADELAVVLLRYFTDEDFKRMWMEHRGGFVEEQCFRPDGESTMRVIQLIRSMIAGRETPEAECGSPQADLGEHVLNSAARDALCRSL